MLSRSNRHRTSMGGSGAFWSSDRVTQKTLIDVEREDQGKEQKLLKRGIRYRGGVAPLQKSIAVLICLCRLAPWQAKMGGWWRASGHGSGRRVLWGSAGAQAAAGEQFPLHITSTLTIISLMQQSLFHFYWGTVPELRSLPGMPARECKGTPTGIIPISNGA